MLAHIFTDLHENFELLEKELDKSEKEADVIILNGDFWDSHKHSADPYAAKEMALLIKNKIIPNKKIILHYGNHDLHYHWFQNRYVKCSGFNYEKLGIISNILTTEDWNNFKWFTEFGNFLISHAGINQSMLTEDVYFNFSLFNNIAEILNKGEDSYLYGAGYARYGSQECGGIVWQDWRLEFNPLSGINQIVGHTPNGKNPVRENSTINSINYCFDGGEDNIHKCILKDDWITPIFEPIGL